MVRPVIVPATRQLSEAHYSTLPGDSEVRLNPGVRLAGGELEIVGEIGRGGLAVVYRAIDHTTGTEVALKIGTAQAEGQRTPLRFRREHRIGDMLGQHEQIVRPLRVGMLHDPPGFEGRMYLVSELVEGKPLDIVMAVHPHGLDVRHACAIGWDIGQALVAMHARGIVHRDIKPGNVLVSGEGEKRARLIDFGLAYVRGDAWAEPSESQTREASVSGTALYMAPEQALGRCPAPAADIYAFGAMLYEILSGSPPHDRLSHAELLARKCDRTRSPISIRRMCKGLDPRLADIIDRCLVYEPSERPTARELVAAFGELMAVASSRPRNERGATRGYSALTVILSVISAVAVTTVVVLLLMWPGQQPVEAEPASPPPPKAAPASVLPDSASSAAVEPAAPAVPRVSEPESAPRPAPRPAPKVSSAASRRASDAVVPEPKDGKPKDGTDPPSSDSEVSSAKTDECSATVTRAKRAALQRQWGRVLRMTDTGECWTGSAASQRNLLRTQAYFETGRDSKCVRAGRGSSDPQVIRLVSVCEARMEASGG